jgi:GT2 family glycosyltransferase
MEPLVDQFRLSWWRVAREYQQRVAMTDFDHLTDMDVEQPPGACLMMRRADFLGLGVFDESLPLFYSDVDRALLWRSTIHVMKA